MALGQEVTGQKRMRRVNGACSNCKRRKIRCDSDGMYSGCSYCRTTRQDCSLADSSEVSTDHVQYAVALENRIEKMERLLNKLLPGLDFTEQLESDADIQHLLPQAEKLPRNDEVPNILKKLRLDPDGNRFFGKSSGIQFVQTALDFRYKAIGLSPPTCAILPNKRTHFWDPPQWLLPSKEPAPEYSFPEADLLPALVDLYFKEVNCYFPVMHRPTFDRKVADGLHLVDPGFAATLLMVCSLGSRFSDDPRILLDGEKGDCYHSAGWKWHNQVRVIPLNLIYKPDLYELQVTALSALYLQALSPTVLGWIQIGFGLRRAQDVGAHRLRKQPRPTAENEQWKRVFWVLLCLEWLHGTRSGRPIVMHQQDFDQELPLECDDEYWDLPEPNRFKQPNNKPSLVSFFVSFVKLLEIQAQVTSALYSPRQPVPPINSQTIISFDSALNSWLSQVPNHLRWDPERQNRVHFNQSVLLYTAYYNLQILLHRPFIPAPLQASLAPDAQPSLTICTTAARSCSRVLEAQAKRSLHIHPNALSAAFAAGIVLLLNVWSHNRSHFIQPSSSKELELVHKILDVVNTMEDRYIGAGRYV
ncbi:fungal-specific transcription factor domain-containing protein [Roridomyces roridus]|uniref:Fungal-specific transcription factor domain-containing protein n=1 Tax=Roridomyces roridus TaxID=1738132 RepID=A0AAD7FWI4_9AGAR|nr:fungal-specific transcription factor domain-containing protein [Roridomyces roridus]